ncbi:MAG: chemotaxis protein CheW [Anaerolineales bacterium]|nr:chemotaxis protein CheW [Anaerolineales bacterium]
MENQIVIFELGGEQFGVEISAVESIVQLLPITHVPQAPPFVRGVTNLRGRVLPVLDLYTRFGLTEQGETKEQRIVVVQCGGIEAGIIVDGVSEVITLDPTQVEPPPPLTRTAASEFVSGIAKLGERIVILLDLRKVLSAQEKEQVAILVEQ